MQLRSFGLMAGIVSAFAVVGPLVSHAQTASLDDQLEALLKNEGFKGDLEERSLKKLGRPINKDASELGRHLFFDRILSLANDNSCSGCHAPQFGFADSQSIAIGVGNNCKVGPGRSGPHNQRRSPTVANAVLYPVMMWNGRFSATAGDSFDNSGGFLFPAPEANTKFAPFEPAVKSLMAAQGHMPPTELPEMAGFRKAEGQQFQFSRFGGEFGVVEGNTVRRASGVTLEGAKVNNLRARAQFRLMGTTPAPPPGPCGTVPDELPDAEMPITSPNEPIRRKVLKRLRDEPAYVAAFAKAFPGAGTTRPISFSMVGEALSEFQNELVFAKAPIDLFARGDRKAMTDSQKRGALVFFGKGKCSSCHNVSSGPGELFSDFQMHNIGVPPLYPEFEAEGNVEFKGHNKDLDLGLAEFTDEAKREDWYRFRTSPLRNVGLAPTFMHNGAYTRLEDAIEHHLDAKKALLNYDPSKAGVKGLTKVANRHPIAATISPLLANPISLTSKEKADLVAFVRDGLTDPRARPAEACKRIPTKLLSGLPLPAFEGC